MKLAMIGIGKMGYNLSLNLINHGHEVVAFDANEAQLDKVVGKGALRANSLENLVEQLDRPRILMLLVPDEEVTENGISTLKSLPDKGDIVIGEGNSNYKKFIQFGEDLHGGRNPLYGLWNKWRYFRSKEWDMHHDWRESGSL